VRYGGGSGQRAEDRWRSDRLRTEAAQCGLEHPNKHGFSERTQSACGVRPGRRCDARTGTIGRCGEWRRLRTRLPEQRYTGARMAPPRPANQSTASGDRVADRWVPLVSEFSIFRNSRK
jgi:hypothetical protein